VLIVIEALKIEKISCHRRVRVWFLFLFAVAAATYLTMPSNTNIISYREELQQFLLTREAFPLPPREFFDSLIREILLIVVSLFFILLYAITWIDSQMRGLFVKSSENDKMRPVAADLSVKGNAALKLTLRNYPKFLLLATTTVVPYIFSILLMNIPLYIYLSMFSMTIFIIVYEEKKIPEAMNASYIMTKGMKFFIFISFMFLRSVLSIISSVLQLIFASGTWSASLINSFFYALKTLAFGRLGAMLYHAFRTGGLKNDKQRF